MKAIVTRSITRLVPLAATAALLAVFVGTGNWH